MFDQKEDKCGCCDCLSTTIGARPGATEATNRDDGMKPITPLPMHEIQKEIDKLREMSDELTEQVDMLKKRLYWVSRDGELPKDPEEGPHVSSFSPLASELCGIRESFLRTSRRIDSIMNLEH